MLDRGRRRVFDGFRGKQSQSLHLFTPMIAVLAEIGDQAAQLSNQSIGCRMGSGRSGLNVSDRKR